MTSNRPSLGYDIDQKHRGHPLAPLFWSQIILAYGLPLALALANWRRGDNTYPSRATLSFCAIYPFIMVAAAAIFVAADFTRIFGCVVVLSRKLPGVVVGALYAVAAFITVSLVQSAGPNISIAWADYVVDGTVIGINILLLLLVIEIFATVGFVCQVIALIQRWRRLSLAGAIDSELGSKLAAPSPGSASDKTAAD